MPWHEPALLCAPRVHIRGSEDTWPFRGQPGGDSFGRRVWPERLEKWGQCGLLLINTHVCKMLTWNSFQDFLMLVKTFSIHYFTCSFYTAQIINANLISLKSQAEATFRPCCKWEDSKVTLRLEVAMV